MGTFTTGGGVGFFTGVCIFTGGAVGNLAGVGCLTGGGVGYLTGGGVGYLTGVGMGEGIFTGFGFVTDSFLADGFLAEITTSCLTTEGFLELFSGVMTGVCSSSLCITTSSMTEGYCSWMANLSLSTSSSSNIWSSVMSLYDPGRYSSSPSSSSSSSNAAYTCTAYFGLGSSSSSYSELLL